MHASERLTVGILIFDDVEVLDFCGPFEVFASSRSLPPAEQVQPLFTVLTIAEHDRVVTCRGGLLVQPQATFARHPALDILLVPGGQGTRREVRNGRLLDWIVAQSASARLTTSVCTGAFLLAERGLLDGRRATTHWGSIERMRQAYPAVRVIDTERVVDEGHIVTSAGISAGIDMSLYIVARLHGQNVAKQTARQMEYAWDQDRGSPQG